MPDRSPTSDAFEGADHGSGTPQTRRELRERERATQTRPTAEVPRARRAPQARRIERRLPPLAPTPVTAHVTPRGRRWVTQGFLAMTFAALMAVATSVPANALLSTDDVQAQLIAAKVAAIPAGDTQAIIGDGDGAAPEQVTRDGVTARSAEEVAALSHMQTANTFTNNPNGTIQWPFPVGVPISSGFGARTAPTEGASTFHEGVDFVPGAGTPIHIIADGVVRQVFPLNDNGCGVHAIIDHIIKGRLVSSVYCHMQVGSLRVAAGQHVKVGDIVGKVGSTGISTGAHLHFEIRLNGTQAVDPIIWLKANAN